MTYVVTLAKAVPTFKQQSKYSDGSDRNMNKRQTGRKENTHTVDNG